MLWLNLPNLLSESWIQLGKIYFFLKFIFNIYIYKYKKTKEGKNGQAFKPARLDLVYFFLLLKWMDDLLFASIFQEKKNLNDALFVSLDFGNHYGS